MLRKRTIFLCAVAAFIGYAAMKAPHPSSLPAQAPTSAFQTGIKGPAGDPADLCPDPAACRKANRLAYEAAPERAQKKEPRWTYSDSTDAMRGTTSQFASLRSDTPLQFAFPYNGGSQATLTVRRMGGKTEVMLQVSKGQFTCHSYAESHVDVKFDAGKVQRFACGAPADHSSDVVFINPAGEFVSSLKASKRLIVEAPFFQEGARQITFETEGLKWR